MRNIRFLFLMLFICLLCLTACNQNNSPNIENAEEDKYTIKIGNDVYMQYEKLENGYKPLANKNVDTGFGFERNLMYINGLTDGYKTDLFEEVIAYLEKVSNITYGESVEETKSMRIIADHIRTTVMLIGDMNGIVPSNVGAGYILRRIMRRAIRHSKKLNIDTNELINVAKIYIEKVYMVGIFFRVN